MPYQRAQLWTHVHTVEQAEAIMEYARGEMKGYYDTEVFENLAYLRCRMERIEQVRWALAGAMDDASKAHLSRHELSYSERCEPRAPRAPAPFPREPPRTAGPPPPVDTSPRVVAGSTSYSPSSRWRTTST